MKVLVATRLTQGKRPSDFSRCVDGELVWMIDPCPMSRHDPDDACGCGRSFSGMSSHGYTTTATIADIVGLTRRDYEAALVATFEAHDWCPCCTAHPIADVVNELLVLAQCFPVGAVLERRLDTLNVREMSDRRRM
jgi:hypothetical protein